MHGGMSLLCAGPFTPIWGSLTTMGSFHLREAPRSGEEGVMGGLRRLCERLREKMVVVKRLRK